MALIAHWPLSNITNNQTFTSGGKYPLATKDVTVSASGPTLHSLEGRNTGAEYGQIYGHIPELGDRMEGLTDLTLSINFKTLNTSLPEENRTIVAVHGVYISLVNIDNKLSIVTWIYGMYHSYTPITPIFIDQNRWYNIILSVSGGVRKIYLNGIMMSSDSCPDGNSLKATPLTYGRVYVISETEFRSSRMLVSDLWVLHEAMSDEMLHAFMRPIFDINTNLSKTILPNDIATSPLTLAGVEVVNGNYIFKNDGQGSANPNLKFVPNCQEFTISFRAKILKGTMVCINGRGILHYICDSVYIDTSVSYHATKNVDMHHAGYTFEDHPIPEDTDVMIRIYVRNKNGVGIDRLFGFQFNYLENSPVSPYEIEVSEFRIEKNGLTFYNDETNIFSTGVISNNLPLNASNLPKIISETFLLSSPWNSVELTRGAHLDISTTTMHSSYTLLMVVSCRELTSNSSITIFNYSEGHGLKVSRHHTGFVFKIGGTVIEVPHNNLDESRLYVGVSVDYNTCDVHIFVDGQKITQKYTPIDDSVFGISIGQDEVNTEGAVYIYKCILLHDSTSINQLEQKLDHIKTTSSVSLFKSMFENDVLVTSSVPRLWETFMNSDGENCYRGLVDAKNYNDIPFYWGGRHTNNCVFNIVVGMRRTYMEQGRTIHVDVRSGSANVVGAFVAKVNEDNQTETHVNLFEKI